MLERPAYDWDEHCALRDRWSGQSIAAVPDDQEALRLAYVRGSTAGGYLLMGWLTAMLREPELFGASDIRLIAASGWLDTLKSRHGKPDQDWLEAAVTREIGLRLRGRPCLMREERAELPAQSLDHA